MKKAKAIELLKLAVPVKALTQQEYSDFVEAVNMWIDALEQPTSPNTIDRKAALDALRRCQTYLYDARDPELKIELSSAEAAINNLPTIQPVATDTNVGDTISKFIDGLEEIFADLRERHVDDSVCRLCEYDGAYMGQSGDWCNECPGFDRDDCFKLSDKTRKEWTEEIIKALPTVQPEKAQLSKEGTTSDTISRQVAIDAFDKAPFGYLPDQWMSIKTLKELPPAQPEPHEGHWIKHETPDGGEQYECSQCGVLWEFTDGTPEDNEAYFCPKCGARMKGERQK